MKNIILFDLKKAMCATDRELADFFAVTPRTIIRWKEREDFPHPFFKQKALQHLEAIAQCEEAGA